MFKKILTLLLLFSIVSLSQTTDLEEDLKTQEEDIPNGFNYGGVISANFSQTSLSNWASGGNNSAAVNSLFNLFLTYRRKNTIWNNTLDIGYGLLKQGSNGEVVKTDDHIELNSKYGVKAAKNWYYSGMINFVTQMANGYQDAGDSIKISTPLAPGYFTGAVGMDYQKDDNFNLYLSPITTKITLVYDDELSDKGSFGVEEGENYRVELGGYIRTHYRRKLMENIILNTDLSLFSNFLNQPQNADIDWKVLVNMKVNEYISANLNTHLIYDHDIKSVNKKGIEKGPKVQFKEIFGVGISYSF
jgi:hypothetical protein